ncbi:hypothetical protein [Mammaliicoccus vitulinus]|uniref:hypothetical protein n=1 Tax=Mammaliicoccus vitulinus TaxID=71237 RepID=UPI00248B0025|nr:hypothetical protein [Mammaliicoccus vitulinus]
MNEVKNYSEFLKNDRQIDNIDSFKFTIEEFENLIDLWTPFDEIPVLLRTTLQTLDDFCKQVYNMPFKDTYLYLTGITNLFMRKCHKSLAQKGHIGGLQRTDIYMGLNNTPESNVNITIVNDLPNDDQPNNIKKD